MKILLTGGSGDLGQVLSKRLEARGDVPIRLDVRAPIDPRICNLIKKNGRC